MSTQKASPSRIGRSKKEQNWIGKALRFGLPVLALVLIVALIYDAQKVARRIAREDAGTSAEERIARDLTRINRGLELPPYQDPHKGFSIAVPYGWEMDPTGQGGYYDVTFRGPGALELSALAVEVEYNDFARLRRLIEKKEMDIGLRMHIIEDEFNGMPALYRTVRLETQQIHTIDFLAAGQSHHLLFAAPYDLYENYLPVMLELMKTYDPLPASD